MVALTQLWLPIVLAAVAVFVASSVVHMVLKWHNSEYGKLPNEDQVRATIRQGGVAQGQYIMPYCSDMKDMGKPEMQQKYVEGPVGYMVLMPNGAPNMGPQLGKWFALNLVVAVFVAYLVSRTVMPGAEYLQVFRVAGTVTFLAYGIGPVADAIWWSKPGTLKYLADALIYGLVTGGVFGSLWPSA